MPADDSERQPRPKRILIQRGPGHYWSLTIRSARPASFASLADRERDSRNNLWGALVLDLVALALWLHVLIQAAHDGQLFSLTAMSGVVVLLCRGFFHVTRWKRQGTER